MVVKLMLDANVLLDYTLKRSDYVHSKKLVDKIIDEDIQAYVTTSALSTCCFYLQKYYGLSLCKKILLELLDVVRLVDGGYEAVVAAVNSKWTDIEDAIHYFTALNNKIDYFITLDKGLYRYSSKVLTITSPESMIKILN